MEKIKAWKIIVALLVVAIAEVSVTAFLVEKLGVALLIVVYVITTVVGCILVWMNSSRQKELFVKIRSMDMDTLPTNPDERKNDPRVLYFGEIVMAFASYWLAVFLIIIPGVVTDFLGLVILILWSGISAVKSHNQDYEPKL